MKKLIYIAVAISALFLTVLIVRAATITTILGTDTISSSRTVINTNFTNLNTDKAELSGATFTGHISAPTASISGNLDVDEDFTANNVNVVSTLYTDAIGIYVAPQLTISSNTSFDENASVSSNLEVDGSLILNSATLDANTTVASNGFSLDFGKTDVTGIGNITAGRLIPGVGIPGSFLVVGESNFYGSLAVIASHTNDAEGAILTVAAGDGIGTGYYGGDLELIAGSYLGPLGSGDGGSVRIYGGSASASSGGNVNIEAGSATISGTAGSIYLNGGQGNQNASAGSVTIDPGTNDNDPILAGGVYIGTNDGSEVLIGRNIGYIGLLADASASQNLEVDATASASYGHIDNYLDFRGLTTNPTAPAAGIARFHAFTQNGFTRYEQDNEAATNVTLGRDSVFIGKNTSGGDFTAGQLVYVTGSTGNVPNLALAKADSATTLPAVGIVVDAIANNAFGQVMQLGIIQNIDTSAFSSGDRVYVSATTAGALTNVRPTNPNYVQRIGSVLVDGVGNGSYQIAVAPFVGGMETGTNASTYLFGGSASVSSLLELRGGASVSGTTYFGTANISFTQTVDGLMVETFPGGSDRLFLPDADVESTVSVQSVGVGGLFHIGDTDTALDFDTNAIQVYAGNTLVAVFQSFGSSFSLPFDLGANNGVRFSTDGDGALTLLGEGNGSDEDLTLNFDDTADTIVLSTSTGVTKIDFATIGIDVDSGTLTAGVLAGALDCGGCTSLEMPNGAAPTIDAIGEFALDTTDNQFIIASSTTQGPLVYPSRMKLWGATIPSTSIDFPTGGRIWLPPLRDGFTVQEIHCAVDGGTSKVINLSNSAGTTDSETVTCDADGASDTAIGTNPNYAAGSLNSLELGAVSGEVDYVTFEIYGTYTRE